MEHEESELGSTMPKAVVSEFLNHIARLAVEMAHDQLAVDRDGHQEGEPINA
jgi:hypothetical protein